MPEPLRLRVPGDKSVTHRGLLLGALADGESRVRAPLVSADTQSTAAVLRALGVRISALEDGEVSIRGRGLRGLRAAAQTLDCGNSGTTVRLLLGVLAAQPLSATLSGDASLRSRPMRRVTQPLAEMGARIRELDAPDRLPLRIEGGALRAIEYDSPHASAQVKSAILVAALCGGVSAVVREPAATRDHSERMLRALGVPIATRTLAGGGNEVALTPIDALPPLDIEVPGDISAAAFLIGAALLRGRGAVVENVGVNPTRTGLLQALARMGASIERVNERTVGGEPVADLLVAPSELRGIEIGGAEIPTLIDELPILAALAVRAHGETVIRDAAELRVKESDRISVMVENLRAIGADAEERADGMVISGSDVALHGSVRTAHDHRIAMAFGVLGALPQSRLHIDDYDIAGVSFPGFWDALRRLAAES